MNRSVRRAVALFGVLAATAAPPRPAGAELVPRTVFAEEFGWIT